MPLSYHTIERLGIECDGVVMADLDLIGFQPADLLENVDAGIGPLAHGFFHPPPLKHQFFGIVHPAWDW